jgi:2-deoxy-D-gluconate 3-dehydrogenase
MTEKSIKQLFDFTGKVAVVTGGAMGIGKGIVTRLAEAGAVVVFTDLNEKVGKETVDELSARGYKVEFVKGDVSSVADAERVMQHAVDKYGGLDVLVNNAGIYPMSAIMDTTESLWDKVFAINVKGTFFHAQAAARKMIESGKGGAIVNLASIDAFHPTGNLVHYDASKGAVVMMTKAMAWELGKHKIRVNAVAPGGIQTPGATGGGGASQLTAEQTAKIFEAFMARIPVGRWGAPDDIAKVVLFLASDAADYVTGEYIITDGGFLQS